MAQAEGEATAAGGEEAVEPRVASPAAAMAAVAWSAAEVVGMAAEVVAR